MKDFTSGEVLLCESCGSKDVELSGSAVVYGEDGSAEKTLVIKCNECGHCLVDVERKENS